MIHFFNRLVASGLNESPDTWHGIGSEFEGDIDLRGLLDIDPNVRSGCREIRVKFKVKGDIDQSTVKELARKSPVFDTLANPARKVVDVEKV